MASLSNTSEANLFAFGQYGSAVLNGQNTSFVPPPGYVVAALQVLGSGIKFSKLESEDELMFFNTLSAAHSKTNDTTKNAAQTDTDFIDMDGNVPAPTKVGDFVYHRANTGIKFIGKVVSIGKDANGDADASMLQLDRKVTLAASQKLSFTTRTSGGGGSSWPTAAVVPQGVTIFGRWTLVEQSVEGLVIAYLAPASIDHTKVEP